MNKELIEKPIIVAICGKSATGKDTLAKFLTNYFKYLGFCSNNIVSATTRPSRPNEKDGVDYFFVSDSHFRRMITNRELIEFTHFRDWQYGVPISSIKPGYINVGVFNPEGLSTLQKNRFDYTVVPIYLEEKFKIRMLRSYHREGRWRLEFLRRAITDYFDFKDLEHKINLSNGRWIHLKEISNVADQARIVKNEMIH